MYNGYYLIFEAKNEVGKHQADAFMEAFSYHYHFNSKNLSLCPCFIMELVGPHMQIYGMIRDEMIKDELIIQIYVHYMNIYLPMHASCPSHCVASTFHAVDNKMTNSFSTKLIISRLAIMAW